MKIKQLFAIGFALILCPMLSHADIYKWKDKSGSTRYADLPPEGNVKHEMFGRKKVIKTENYQPKTSVNAEGIPVAAAAPNQATAKDGAAKQGDGTNTTDEAKDPVAEAAKLRQKNAEIEKKNKQEKLAQAKMDAENCKAARSNLVSFSQGGRIYKTNEKGEREYMDDKGLKDGAANAKKEVAKYCK
jgi:Domain of unknown function (DUF4124)